MKKEHLLMNRKETRARTPAGNLNGRLALPVLNDRMAKWEFAERVQINQHRLRSELKPGGTS
jgi:hypothetical protein